MNAKQTVPLAVTVAPAIAAAPAIIIVGAIGFGIVWLIKNAFAGGKTQSPETKQETSRPPAPVISAGVKPGPPPVVKKLITRADMATIFDNGKRTLSRTAAVAALRRLGFGRSAAYAALSPDGRFSSWLVCASDGIIYWTDEQ